MITLALVAFLFAALPTGLSIRARRYKQAALAFFACLVAPLIAVGIVVGVSGPQYGGLSAAMMGVGVFTATAALFSIFCASLLWKLGKLQAVRK